MVRQLFTIEDDTDDDWGTHPDDNKPFYCPNCGKSLGWYDDCCFND